MQHFKRLIHFEIRLFCRFVQSWSVRNNGEEAWPYGCYIKCSSNESLPVVPVNPIEPGQCTVISVSLTSPSELGSYQTKWRLFTSNGSCFGGMTFIFAFKYVCLSIAFSFLCFYSCCLLFFHLNSMKMGVEKANSMKCARLSDKILDAHSQ